LLESRRRALPLRAERRAGAGELGRRRVALLGDVAEVQVGGIEQVELARRAVASREDVRQRRTVFLRQAKQHVPALLDGCEAARIGLDPRGIRPRRLRQLAHVGERGIEQLPPLSG